MPGIEHESSTNKKENFWVKTDDSKAELRTIATALAAVEKGAKGLPWAKERPWLVSSHLWVEAEVPTIDLHDLGPSLAEKTVDIVAGLAPELTGGAVRFITGRGRHSVGPAVLPRVVGAALHHHATEQGWRVRGGRPGTLLLITDPNAAPNIASGGLGLGFWLMAIAMAVAAVWACPPAGIIGLVLVVVWRVVVRANTGKPDGLKG
jgi:hypothetical protein